MTNFKKTVALILSVVMVLSAMSFSFADDKLNNSGDIGGIIDNYDEVEPQEDVSKGEDLVDDEPSEGDEEPAKGDDEPAVGDEESAEGDEEPAKGDEEPIEVEPAENENEITEEQQPECDCGAAEGDTHSEQCAVNAAEEQPVEDKLVDERPECDCGAAEGEPHAQDCPLAEEDIEGSTADELVTEQLEALPKADELDAEEASEDDELIEEVEAARDAYDDLSEQEQQNINEELLANLAELEMLCGLVDMPIMMRAPKNVNYVAQNESTEVEYESITAAIEDATDKDVIVIYAGTHDEEIKYNGFKNFSLKNSGEVILTGGLKIGIDHSQTHEDGEVVIEGIIFKNGAVKIMGYADVTVTGCEFIDIDDKVAALYIADQFYGNINGNVCITENTFKNIGVADSDISAIRLRDPYNVEIIENNITDVTHNGILLENNKTTIPQGDINISGNIITNWDSDDNKGGGRAMRLSLSNVAGSISVVENSMVKDSLDDASTDPNFLKITGASQGYTSADFTGNYWNSENPDFDTILKESSFDSNSLIAPYYKDADKTETGAAATLDDIVWFLKLEDAVAAANLSENDVVIKLYNDCVVDKALVIKNDNGAVITIDGDKGNGGKYSVVGSDKKVFEVWSDVTFKNVVINNTYTKANARCIDTRTGDIELNVENSELYANTKGYNQQVINIGGKGKNIVANIKGSTITASNNGYGITVYNPVELTLSDFTTSSGYAALYLKAPDNSYGAGGSVVNVMGGTLNGASVSGESFGTISIETTGITVNVDESSTVTAAEGAGANAAIFISDTYMTADVSDGVNNITIKGTINGDILSGDVFTGNTANNIVVKKEYGSKLTDAGYYFVEYSDADYILLSTKVADAVAEAITAANAVLADADATDTEDHLKNPTLATITDAELEDIDVDNMLRDHKDELSAIVFKLENAVSAEELDEYLSKNASERKQIERLYKICEIAFTVLEHASDVEVDESIVTDAVIPELPANAPEGTAAPTKQQTEEAVQGMVDDLTNNDAVNSTAPDGLAEAFEGGGDVSLTIKVQLLGIDVEAVIGADNKLDIVPSVLHFEVTPYKHKIDVENDNEFIGRETPVPNDALKGKGYNITFRLPIPDSITEKYAKVEHEGDAAKYLPIETENGHKFIVLSAYHFSEFKVTFTNKLPYSSSGGGHSTGGAEGKNEEIEAFWEEVEADIKKAKDGDTVRVDAKIKDQMPYTIMTALLDNPGVTLTVKWNEGSVTIPAGRALTPESNRIYYPLDYLAKIYENIDAIPVVKQEPVAPNGGYDKPKNYPVPAPAPAVPTEDREQSASAEKPEVKEPEATQPEIKQPEPPAEVVTVAPAEAERMQLNYPLIAAIVGGVAVLSILVFAIAKMRKGKEY